MNFENIIVIGICFVAIAIVAYYFYSKYTSQQNDMNALSKRFETIEMMFSTPPPQKELSDIYNRKHEKINCAFPEPQRYRTNSGPTDTGVMITKTWENTTNPILSVSPARKHFQREGNDEHNFHQHLLEPLVPSKINCEIGLCDLKPLQLERNDADIHEIVEDESSSIEKIN
jgi:hypothetical protein